MLLTLAIALLLQGAPDLGHRAKAENALSQEDFVAARDNYEAILTADPANPAAQAGEVSASEHLALNARAAKDMNAALGHLLRARKFAPDNPRLLYDLGVLEDELGLYQEADEAVTRLLQLSSSEDKTVYLHARIQLDSGRLSEAEASMATYLSAVPSDATAHYGMGRIYQLQQNNDKAKEQFNTSLTLQPNQTESHFQLADIFLKSGDFQQAILEARKVLARDPHHGGALTVLGTAQYRLKDYPSSAQTLTAAIAAAPDYQTGHYYLGLALAKLNRKQESEEQLALAAKMADDNNRKSAQRLHVAPQ